MYHMLCVHMCVGDWNALGAFHFHGQTGAAGSSAVLSQEVIAKQCDAIVANVLGRVNQDRVWDLPVMLSPLNQWLS